MIFIVDAGFRADIVMPGEYRVAGFQVGNVDADAVVGNVAQVQYAAHLRRQHRLYGITCRKLRRNGCQCPWRQESGRSDELSLSRQILAFLRPARDQQFV